jgi:biopolymer transport protein ExbD
VAGKVGGDGDDDLIVDINVTPLVDIVLVLLIILMVTASYIVSKTIPMELPRSATGENVPNRTLVVNIDQNGRMHLDDQPVDETGLRRRAREAYTADREARAVIAADGRTKHSSVVRVIDLLRQERITKFAINVRPEDLE